MFYSMWNWLSKGGPVMIAIVGFSIIAVAFIIERFTYFRKLRHDETLFTESFTKLWDNNKIDDIIKLCDSTPGPLAKVMKAGVVAYRKNPRAIKARMHEVVIYEVPRLERYLSLISVIATIEPMLGLLGTVVGMIRAFTVIALKGTGDPQELAGGISEALITTEAGLIVAIPLIYLHSVLASRVDMITADIEKGVTNFIAMVEEK